jgi:hypothetical protein
MKDDPIKDDTGTAPESGDPQSAGRSRGKVTEPAGDRDAPDRSDQKTGTEPESGRQDASPRSGR